MGKHKDIKRKKEARKHNTRKKYGTDSYTSDGAGSSEWTDDENPENHYGDMADEGMHDPRTVDRLVEELNDPCGQAASAFFCLASLAMSAFVIYYAHGHNPAADGVDCGESNPLNISYYNWLLVFGISMALVFLLQLLMLVLGCCTESSRSGDVESSNMKSMSKPLVGREKKTLKAVRRIACASLLVMVVGSVLLGWLAYGAWVFAAPIDLFHNGTTFKPTQVNRHKFASVDCFQLHRLGFLLEIVGGTYVIGYIARLCCCGVGFSKVTKLLKPAVA